MKAAAASFEEQSLTLFQQATAIEGAPAPRVRKIWGLEHRYHCPVVGTCLPMAEVRRIALRHRLVSASGSDYEAHVSVVAHCESRNPVSLALQRLLDKRHALWVGRFGRTRDEAGVAAAWQEALASGEVAGALWALLTARAGTDGLRQRAFQDVHMLSHQVGAGTRADLQRLAARERELAEMKHAARAERALLEAALAERDAELGTLRRHLREANAELQTLRGRLATNERRGAAAEFERLSGRRAEAQRAAQRVPRRGVRLKQRGHENANQAVLLRHAEEERDALERFVLGEMRPAGCTEAASGACGHALAGRRLLCVGGRCNLAGRYRELVEETGGQFAWHDGGRDESLNRLHELLSAADAVICPADCVSHSAYYQIKRHCKRMDKPCVLLRNSGLASFAVGLARLGKGEVEIGGAPGADAVQRLPAG
jgi:hypothetical protein